MPGPVSDSYDPEFGTGELADKVMDAIQKLSQRVTDIVGSSVVKDADEIRKVLSRPGPSFTATLTEREWRIIRFALNRALKDI